MNKLNPSSSHLHAVKQVGQRQKTSAANLKPEMETPSPPRPAGALDPRPQITKAPASYETSVSENSSCYPLPKY